MLQETQRTQRTQGTHGASGSGSRHVQLRERSIELTPQQQQQATNTKVYKSLITTMQKDTLHNDENEAYWEHFKYIKDANNSEIQHLTSQPKLVSILNNRDIGLRDKARAIAQELQNFRTPAKQAALQPRHYKHPNTNWRQDDAKTSSNDGAGNNEKTNQGCCSVM